MSDEEYLLASDEELERLQTQAKVWEPDARTLLSEIGVAPGWNCIDVGCGAMGLLGPLANFVGPSGRVLGIDRDFELLKAAGAYAEREGLSPVELREGSLEDLDLGGEQFELVHSRFFLPHVSEPESALEKMVELTAPGGVVALQENDHSSWGFYPPCPEWPRLLRLLEEAFSSRGDLNIGRRIFHMLKGAGLKDVQIRAACHALQDRHPYMRMPLVGAEALRARVLQDRLATEKEYQDLINGVEECVKDPERIHITFTLVQAWGKKPA